jgi:hypothetical protein
MSGTPKGGIDTATPAVDLEVARLARPQGALQCLRISRVYRSR